MIAIKALLTATGASQSSRVAGIESGDIAVKQEILSTEFGEWKCVEFQSPETVPEKNGGRSWWTHQWTFKQPNLTALVAFDQAGWASWHELTECYQNTGWTLTSRTIVNQVDQDQLPWDYAFATFERNGTGGVLLFSEFYDDGTPVEPASFTLQEAIEWAKRNEQATQTNDLGGRFEVQLENEPRPTKSHSRVLQCQVFLPVPTDHQHSDHPKLEALHLDTRDQMRAEWIRQAEQSAQNSQTKQNEGKVDLEASR